MVRNDRAQTPAIGRRERGKLAKLQRIRAVAHRLFAQQGFESTTTRQIAAEADIGAGTLFLYAPTKEALLVLVFQDEVGGAVDRAFERVPERPLLDQVMHVFDAIVAHHAAEPVLARLFVKELPFVGGEREGVDDFIRRLYTRVAALAEAAKQRGEVAADTDAWLLAQNLFGLFFQHLQMWLGGAIAPLERGDPRLRAALELQLRGVRARR